MLRKKTAQMKNSVWAILTGICKCGNITTVKQIDLTVKWR